MQTDARGESLPTVGDWLAVVVADRETHDRREHLAIE